MNFQYLLSPKNFIKALRSPRKILPTLTIHWHQFITERFDANYQRISKKKIASIRTRSLAALERISTHASPAARQLSVVAIAEAYPETVLQEQACEHLGRLFTDHGSDKASKHDYHRVYWALLRDRQHDPLQLLEIGLGTNNIRIPANMGRLGKPGASLRAFRDYLPRALLYGGDIDKSTFFTEDRINTFFVDQTDTAVLTTIANRFGPQSFDIIIDDGLHNSEANLNTLEFALPLLRPNGVLIIEDISKHDIYLYHIVHLMLRDSYSVQLVRAKTDIMCVLQRR